MVGFVLNGICGLQLTIEQSDVSRLRLPNPRRFASERRGLGISTEVRKQPRLYFAVVPGYFLFVLVGWIRVRVRFPGR